MYAILDKVLQLVSLEEVVGMAFVLEQACVTVRVDLVHQLRRDVLNSLLVVS